MKGNMEDLQLNNKELKEVNDKLKTQIKEVTTLYDDLNNQMIGTETAFLFLDPNLHIIRFTPALQVYLSIKQGDIGKSVLQFTKDINYPNLKEDLENVRRTSRMIQMELKTKNGYALIKIIPYKCGHNTSEGFGILFNNITDLKTINSESNWRNESLKSYPINPINLPQAEQSLKSDPDNTPDIVARLDNRSNILYISDSLKTYTGIEAGTVIGKNLSTLKTKSHYAELIYLNQFISRALNKKEQISFPHNFQLDGIEKSFLISIIPENQIMDHSTENLLLIARDISNLRPPDAEDRVLRDKLKDMNQYMDSIVHTVAHDLRSPLTNLKLILDLLSDEDILEKREMLIGKLEHSVIRIDNILNGLIEIIDRQVNTTEKE